MSMVRVLACMMGIVWCFSLNLGAQQQSSDVGGLTKSSNIIYKAFVFEDKPTPYSLMERFEDHFLDRAPKLFANRLRAANFTRWTLRYSDDNMFVDRVNSTAKGALTRSLRYSGREIVAESFLYDWLTEKQETLGRIFKDSVGGVDEEELVPLEVSYRSTERSWFDELQDNGTFRYGVRPLRTSPYAYVSLRVQHHKETLFLLHARYYCHHFSEHRFETALSVPLQHRLSLDVGYSFGVGESDYENRLAIKLNRRFKNGKAFFVGYTPLDEGRVLVGFTSPW